MKFLIRAWNETSAFLIVGFWLNLISRHGGYDHPLTWLCFVGGTLCFSLVGYRIDVARRRW